MVKTRNENGNLGGNITKFSFFKKKRTSYKTMEQESIVFFLPKHKSSKVARLSDLIYRFC